MMLSRGLCVQRQGQCSLSSRCLEDKAKSSRSRTHHCRRTLNVNPKSLQACRLLTHAENFVITEFFPAVSCIAYYQQKRNMAAIINGKITQSVE